MDENGIIMGISHKVYDVRGLQFHPESVLTEHGLDIIDNWLEYSAATARFLGVAIKIAYPKPKPPMNPRGSGFDKPQALN